MSTRWIVGWSKPGFITSGMSFTPFARAVSITRGSTCPRIAPGRIHREDLRGDDRDLVGVREKRLDALLAAQVPEGLETLGMGVSARQAGHPECGERREPEPGERHAQNGSEHR